MSTFGSRSIVAHRCIVISSDSEAVFKESTKVVLSVGQVLGSCGSVPLFGHFVDQRNALTRAVKVTEIVLCNGVATYGAQF